MEADERRYLASLKARYTLPRSRWDEHSPYTLATQWLAAASVDVAAIEREFKPMVLPWDLGDDIIPLYTITWEKGSMDEGNYDSAATVQVILPEHILWSLVVKKPEDILRDPLIVSNRSALLSEPNSAKTSRKANEITR